jgi:hypothetical protein
MTEEGGTCSCDYEPAPRDVVTGFPGHFILNGDTSWCPCREHRTEGAREALERTALTVGSPEYSTWFGLLLDAYRDDIAHELAEKIRNHEWDECGYGDTNCPCDAAALIDPEVP